MGFLQGYARKLGVLEYLGVWDASSNTPTLTSSQGQKGGYYVVSKRGNTVLDGLSEFDVNDWVIFNGTAWEKIDNSDLTDLSQKVKLYEDNAAVYADGFPPKEDPAYRDGWYFRNYIQGQKVNWYFFDGQAEQILLKDFSAYAIVTFDSLVSKPHLAFYTFPTGSGDVGGWYKSRLVYIANQTPVVGVKYLMYFGQDPKTVHPELPRLTMSLDPISTKGPQADLERVMTSVIGTDSGTSANNCQFVCEAIGISSPTINRKLELCIKKPSLETLNSTVDVAKDRANHTGTQLAETIADFSSAVQGSIVEVFDAGDDIDLVYPNVNGKVSATLKPTGVAAGTYNNVRVDENGRIVEAFLISDSSALKYFHRTNSSNATTLQTFMNIPELSTVELPVGLYKFNFISLAYSTSISTGVGVRLACTSGDISTIYGKYSISQSVPGTTQAYEYDQTSEATNITSSSSPSTSYGFVVKGEGIVRVTTPAVLTMQFRSEVENSAVLIDTDAHFSVESV